MAWGLEARVPFLDKKFLDVAMSIDSSEKMFRKGGTQEVDADGQPKMEKVCLIICDHDISLMDHQCVVYSPQGI